MVQKRILLGLTGLLLISCSEPVNRLDYPSVRLPQARVSDTEVKVGELVMVTLAEEFYLDPRSRVSDRVTQQVELGACVLDENRVAIDGLCLPGEDTTNKKSFKLLEGENITRSFGNVTIRRGETLKFSHSFTFTLTKSGRIYFDATIRTFALKTATAQT